MGYKIKTFARQLFGDSGNELFHIHAGYQASAANGKTKFFEILHYVLGDYICKFDVGMLTAKHRIEPGKPMPEYQYWRAVRILYCTEPNHSDMLNSGIMKDLTGGEAIVYRMLYSNEVQKYRPMFKMHIMCNDPPQVDGSDSGVKRRIRKIDYISRFVDDAEVDVTQHMYKRDPHIIQQFKDDDALKMEFLRLLLDHYVHEYEYEMPEVIKHSSLCYLEENDAIFKFTQDSVVKSDGATLTLSDAKEAFRRSEHYNGKLATLKNDLIKALRTPCHDFKRIDGKLFRNVFIGFKLAEAEGQDWRD